MLCDRLNIADNEHNGYFTFQMIINSWDYSTLIKSTETSRDGVTRYVIYILQSMILSNIMHYFWKCSTMYMLKHSLAHALLASRPSAEYFIFHIA